MVYRINAPRERTSDHTGELFACDGVTPARLDDGDLIRFKFGRDVNVPILELSNDAVTPNGSTVTILDQGNASTPARYNVRFAEGDLPATIAPGAYDSDVSVVDASESASQNPLNKMKFVEFGIVHVISDKH